jgi:hypothetical protein
VQVRFGVQIVAVVVTRGGCVVGVGFAAHAGLGSKTTSLSVYPYPETMLPWLAGPTQFDVTGMVRVLITALAQLVDSFSVTVPSHA